MLVTLQEVLPRAKREHYAVGLFNTVNLEMAKGVLAAAEELASPVIIGSAEILLPYASLKELASFLLPMAGPLCRWCSTSTTASPWRKSTRPWTWASAR